MGQFARHLSSLSMAESHGFRTAADDDFGFAGLPSVNQSADALPFHGQFSSNGFGLNWNMPAFNFGLSEFVPTERSPDVAIVVWQVFQDLERSDKRRIHQRIARKIFLGIVESS